MAVETALERVRRVATDLEKSRAPVGIDEVELHLLLRFLVSQKIRSQARSALANVCLDLENVRECFAKLVDVLSRPQSKVSALRRLIVEVLLALIQELV